MAGIIEVKDQGKLRIYDADNSHYVDIVVPSSVTANRTITIPDASFTVPQVTNATHSGEVTGATALTIADNIVDEANLKVSNSPTNGYMLTAQSGNTGGLTWAAAGGGKILQVVNSTIDYAQTSTSTSETDILSASGTTWETAITPSATSSKILIQASVCIYNAGTSGTLQEARFNLRSYTKIGAGSYSNLLYQEGFGHYYYNGAQRATLAPNTLTFSKLYTPSTTSAVTFKFAYDLVASGATIEVNAGSKISSLTLFEIAG